MTETEMTPVDALFTYKVRNGHFKRDGHLLTVGYSGFGEWMNDPDAEARRGQGPIPRGLYMIGPPRTSGQVGPLAMYLWPIGHRAHDRSALMIHGDNKNRTASRGCIILERGTRMLIANEVTAAALPLFLRVY